MKKTNSIFFGITVVISLLASTHSHAQQAGIIDTIAGGGAMELGDGGPATEARLSNPLGLFMDSQGTLFIVDNTNNRIRKVNSDGVISTFIGTGSPGSGKEGELATQFPLQAPVDLTADAQGNYYVVDDARILKVTPGGIVTAFAGSYSHGFSGDGGPAKQALLNHPRSVVLDNNGNVFISEQDRIRKISTDGTITTVVGIGEPGFSGDGGPATLAKINNPGGMTFDSLGNLLFIDSGNDRVRKVNSDGMIQTLKNESGVDVILSGGFNKGEASSSDLISDINGNLYVSGGISHRVFLIDPKGSIYTIAGVGEVCQGENGPEGGFSGDNGPAIYAEVNYPSGLALDSQQNLYVSDTQNGRVRKILKPADSIGSTPQDPRPLFIFGDVSGDGKVDLRDVTMALQAAVGSIALSEEETRAATHRCEGVNISDVTALLRKAVGL